MSKKKKKSAPVPQRPQPKSLTPKLERQLLEINELIEDSDLVEAQEQLEVLQQANPRQPDILQLLVNLALEMDDMRSYLRYAQKLSQLLPGDEDALLATAGGYLNNMFPALAIQTFRTFVRRFPNHERVEEINKTAAGLEETLLKSVFYENLAGQELLALAAEQDATRVAMTFGLWDEARSAIKKLLQHYPDFVPALNNLSQVEFMLDNIDAVIFAARRVLEIAPQNIHALGNLARGLAFRGKSDEAAQIVAQLKAAPITEADHWIKKLETFSLLGDDQAVENSFQSAQQSKHQEYLNEIPMFWHLGAAAVLRLGNEKAARSHWQQALRVDPNFAPARANLDDLSNPPHERNAPWAFDMYHWLPRNQLKKLLVAMQTRSDHKHALASQRAERILEPFTDLIRMLPVLLARSNEDARRFVLNLARALPSPQVLAMLRDYALSQSGPDALRFEAVNIAREHNSLPPNQLPMWVKGEWTEIRSLGFTVTEEPTYDYGHSAEVIALMEEAIELTNNGDADDAEELFHQALAIEPDKPDLLNNLATVYIRQQRDDEAEVLIRRLYADYPSYLFGILNMANTHVRHHEYEKAQELLAPLIERPTFHITEFRAMCESNINLFSAMKKPEYVKSWINTWEMIEPDHPRLDYWKKHKEPQSVLKKLGNLFSGLRSNQPS